MLLLKPKCLPYLRIKKYETNVHPIITHNAVLAAIFGWLYWTNTFDVPAILLYYCSRKESKMIASLNLGICKSLKTFWGRWTNIRNQILLLWLNMPTRYKQGHWSSKSYVYKEDNNSIRYYVLVPGIDITKFEMSSRYQWFIPSDKKWLYYGYIHFMSCKWLAMFRF